MAAMLTSEQARLVAPRAGINPTYDNVTPQEVPGYHCNVRVYPSLRWAFEPRSKRDQADYLDYNRTFRPGCAIFVDGELVEASWLYGQPAEIEKISKRLKRYQDPCDKRTKRKVVLLG